MNMRVFEYDRESIEIIVCVYESSLPNNILYVLSFWCIVLSGLQYVRLFFSPLDFYMRKSYQFSKWKYGLGGNYIDLTPAMAISPEQGTLQETVSIFCNGFVYKDHVCEHVLTWSLEIFYSHLT